MTSEDRAPNPIHRDPRREIPDFSCATTGIGSVPHTDPEEAVRDVLARHPELPYWPQMPKRSPREGMIGQFLARFPFLQFRTPSPRLSEAGESATLRDALASVSDEIRTGRLCPLDPQNAAGWFAFLEALEALAPEARPRFAKGQITGPVTVTSLLLDVRGRPLLRFPGLLDAVTCFLEGIAIFQVRALAALDVTPVLFVDEPIFLRFLADEAGREERATLARSLNRLLGSLRREGAVSGVHCCGSVPWDLFFRLDTDLLSFDATRYLESLHPFSDSLAAWVDDGKGLAAGVVPTSTFAPAFDADAAAAGLRSGLDTLVGERRADTCLRRSVLTAACGTSTLAPAKDARIAEALHAVASTLRRALPGGADRAQRRI